MGTLARERSDDDARRFDGTRAIDGGA